MARGPRGPWIVSILLAASLLATAGFALGAHKPHYKGSVDILEPGSWAAHFVWLRNPYFTYDGKVEWEYRVEGEGTVDAVFLDWAGFQAFREGQAYAPLVAEQRNQAAGVAGISGLTPDLPYFLVLRNPGSGVITVRWQIFAEIDWRRWQGQEPGPTLELTKVDGSPLLSRGESWSMAFTEPGFYIYDCWPHADMTALVEVVPAEEAGPTQDVDVRSYGFHPEVLRVPQGTVFHWTNLDGVEHSIQVYLLPEGLPEEPEARSPASALPWVLGVGAAVAGAALVTILALLRARRRP